MLSPIKICAGVFLTIRLFAAPLENALYMDSAVVAIPDQPYLNFQTGQPLTIEILFKVETSEPQNLMNKTAPINKEWTNNVSVLTGWLVDLNSYYLREGDSFVLSTFVAAPSIVHAGITGDAFGVGQNHYVPGMEDQWHHLTFQFTGQRLRTFINSVQIQESEDIDLSSLHTEGVPLLIGGYDINRLASLNGVSSLLKGMIDELRIWNRLRTPAEIEKTLFEALEEPYYTSADSGLVGYYKFDAFENLGVGDDGDSDDIRDWSINGNHADIELMTANEYRNQYEPDLIKLVPHEDTISTTAKEETAQVSDFALSRNFPNPFNAMTQFRIQLTMETQVDLTIFDVRGRQVADPIHTTLSAGSHVLRWDASAQPSGIYVYTLRVADQLESGKMIVEK